MGSSRVRAGTTDEDLLREADLPSVVGALHTGRVRWDLLYPFPRQSVDERALGDRAVDEMADLLRDRIDPVAADAERRLPDGLIDELRGSGLLKLGAPTDLGGRELSPYNVFRALTAAVSWSAAVGPVLTADNGLGAGAFLPLIPPGPLRDWVCERLAAGIVSCTADTEPIGAHNAERHTRAVPTEDGSAYLITGEKIFVANAPYADVIVTTAMLEDQLRLFFVDARDQGLEVKARHDFLGMGGFPNGNLRYDAVRVPAERMLAEDRHEGRLTPAATRMVVRGRMYHVGAPSLAFSRLALYCVRDFAGRRRIDGRPLADYDEVRRLIAESVADTYAIESLSAWSLLADNDRPVNPLYEQLAAKNIASVTCWRIVDRAMSLLGAEGLETQTSKGRRGAVSLPLERVFRDARIMRITGGVDFQLDNWAGRHVLATHYDSPDHPPPSVDDEIALPPGLSARNLGHARRVAADAARLADTCRDLVRRHPDQAELFEAERLLILLSQVVNELLTMAIVLARAAGEPADQAVADVACTAAGHRLDDLWRRLAAVADGTDDIDAAGYAAVTRSFLDSEETFSSGDLVLPATG